MDPLASWKTGIGATSAYVARSASHYDGDIVDNYYPGKAAPSFTAEIMQSSIFLKDLTAGDYVVGIQGKNASANGGAVNYYIMNNSALRALCDYMLNQQDYQVLDISAELLKCIFNPLQYIVSCIWFPFQISGGTTTTQVQFGWWTVTITSGSIRKMGADTTWSSGNQSIDIPTHPQVATRGNYLKASPFSKYYLSAGPFGIVPIDDSFRLVGTSITFWIEVDLITGTGRLEVKTPGSLSIISLMTAQIGVPIQLGQNVLNQGAIVSQLSDAGSIQKSIASFNPFGAAAATQNYIGDYLQSKSAYQTRE